MINIYQPKKVTKYRHSQLIYPTGYWNVSEEYREKNCNGCGTAGWKGAIVPDTMYGLSIVEACNIHDVAYSLGRTLQDKIAADLDFYENLKIIIAENSNWFTRKLRNVRAYWYYKAVAVAGKKAFLAGKDGINA